MLPAFFTQLNISIQTALLHTEPWYEVPRTNG